MSPIAIYEKQIHHYKTALAKFKRQLTVLGYLRLLSFVAMLFFVYKFLVDHLDTMWLWPVCGMLAAFIVALIFYLRTQTRQTLAKTLLELNEKEWRLATTGQSGFYDGVSFVDETHPFTGDLDVFGASSLYSHMNRTGTMSGATVLADYLKSPLQEVTKIRQMQDAVRVLVPKLEFRQQFTAQGILAGEKAGDLDGLRQWLDMPLEFVHNKFVNTIRWISPVLSVAVFVNYAVTGKFYPIVALILINMVILGRFVAKVTRQHNLISNKEQVFRKFALLLQMIAGENFEQAVILQQDQAKAKEANTGLYKFARLCSAMDQRLNMLVGMVLNAFGLYDLHCMVAVEKWKVRYKDELDVWLKVITNMEVYNSMATFAYNHPEYIYPEVDDAQAQLVGQGIGHPLIPAEDCVKNGISIGVPDQFLIITGSNMSGKSTFLRSVGSNLLMALCGMPVCADRFACSPMKIMTSMRIKDSIAKHTSYFQAELLRLQEIVKVLKTGERVFILLDEILKGTNSEDKLSGSRSLILHFLQYNCLGMIATHDLELGHMEEENPGKISNYCFESTIKDEQLYFDYSIREGVARNKNATFLMKKMEII